MKLLQLLKMFDILSVRWCESYVHDFVKLLIVVIIETGIFFKLIFHNLIKSFPHDGS